MNLILFFFSYLSKCNSCWSSIRWMKRRYQYRLIYNHTRQWKYSLWPYPTNQQISLASDMSRVYVSIYLRWIQPYHCKLNWMTNQESGTNDVMSSSMNNSFYYFLYSSQIDHKLVLNCAPICVNLWQLCINLWSYLFSHPKDYTQVYVFFIILSCRNTCFNYNQHTNQPETNQKQ